MFNHQFNPIGDVIFGSIAKAVTSTVDKVKDVVEDTVDAVKEGVKDTVNAVKDGVSSAVNSVTDAAKNFVKSCVDFGSQAFDFIKAAGNMALAGPTSMFLLLTKGPDAARDHYVDKLSEFGQEFNGLVDATTQLAVSTLEVLPVGQVLSKVPGYDAAMGMATTLVSESFKSVGNAAQSTAAFAGAIGDKSFMSCLKLGGQAALDVLDVAATLVPGGKVVTTAAKAADAAQNTIDAIETAKEIKENPSAAAELLAEAAAEKAAGKAAKKAADKLDDIKADRAERREQREEEVRNEEVGKEGAAEADDRAGNTDTETRTADPDGKEQRPESDQTEKPTSIKDEVKDMIAERAQETIEELKEEAKAAVMAEAEAAAMEQLDKVLSDDMMALLSQEISPQEYAANLLLNQVLSEDTHVQDLFPQFAEADLTSTDGLIEFVSTQQSVLTTLNDLQDLSSSVFGETSGSIFDTIGDAVESDKNPFSDIGATVVKDQVETNVKEYLEDVGQKVA